jgi:hypothetical protein
VNQAFVRRTGYTLEDMRGWKPGHLLQGPETDSGTVAQIRAFLAEGKSFGSELLNYTRSRDPYWVAFQITPIRNAEGVVERFVSIQTESTMLRQARIELQAAKERAESAASVTETGTATRVPFGLSRTRMRTRTVPEAAGGAALLAASEAMLGEAAALCAGLGRLPVLSRRRR